MHSLPSLPWLFFTLCLLTAPALAEEAVVKTNVQVAMRDGVKLATDLYLPAEGGVEKPGRYPVILTPALQQGQGEKTGPILCPARLRLCRPGLTWPLWQRGHLALDDR
ncbi:hypothetical protein GCM10023213_42080 [Prosthecobacter algae]|uniref:Uncharacterized protein n=1 Tax=Prosthecobacter algae TaxID=1144682 RepID=A0ABP9PLL8_9BACT